LKKSIKLMLFVLILLISDIVFAENCQVNVASYLPATMKVMTENKKDNKCIVVNFCQGTTFQAVQDSIVDCGTINIFASGYPIVGEVDKSRLVVNDWNPNNIIVMGENPNTFIPYEDMVVVAKNKDKIYVGGRDAAVKGDPYAVSRLMFMWQTYAFGIPGLTLVYFIIKGIIKLKKKLKKSEDQWEDDFNDI